MGHTRRRDMMAALLVVLVGWSSGAWAKDGDGFRFSMGFLAGRRDYAKAGFALETGEVPAAALSEPLRQAPYNGVSARGVTWDLRLVLSQVRMTVGFDWAFPAFDGPSLAGRYAVNGADLEVVPRSISSRQLRFGLGAELPVLEQARLFLDVYGTVDWLTTELAVGGARAQYAATTFGFSASAGVQWYLREHLFVFAAGDAGLGPVVCNARLGVGFEIH